MFTLDPADKAPIYAQLERAVRTAVAVGWLEPGDQLPTVRQLAVDLKINANTVARVYATLERDGLVETQRGVGTFVREPAPGAGHGRKRLLERELRDRSDRFIADTAALGFSIADVINHLQRAYRQEKP
ncbi:MAG TPA: GntR family transcriptional regulator [Candidatus Elarobacter sp.]|nr:GntR family transcriptional regulator [Candidatus Elarobacter sp.]